MYDMRMFRGTFHQSLVSQKEGEHLLPIKRLLLLNSIILNRVLEDILIQTTIWKHALAFKYQLSGFSNNNAH